MKNSLLLVFLTMLILCCIHPEKSEKVPLFTIEPAGDSLEVFAEGIISTHLNERDMAISPDGTEIFYSLFSYDNTVRVLIYLTKNDNKWTQPEIASFSGENFDIEPSFSPDGNRLYFASNRPLNSKDSTKDHNIWFVTKNDSGWTNPQSLDTIINTEAEEFYPSVSSNGNLYFTARYADALGGEDIYMSEYVHGHYSKPGRLDTTVNSVRWEFNAYVSPDERVLIFTSFGRPDDLGGGDLYVSIKDKNNKWAPARNLGADINSQRLDYCPFVDWPRSTFYFTSTRSGTLPEKIISIKELEALSDRTLNGMGNIYRINISASGINN